MRTSPAIEGRRPRLLASTIIVILLAACATPGDPSRTTPTSASTAPGGSTATSPTPAPTVVGPIGRIPLVIRQYSCDVCAYPLGTTILADGRVIWENGVVMSVRRLSTNGLARVRAQIDAMPQLAADASYDVTLIPGASPPAFGPTAHTFLLERGGRRIRVSSADAGSFAGFPDVWVIPRDVAELSALAEKMKDPASWLPPESWASAATDFVPDRLLVSTGRWSPGEGDEGNIDIDAVAWPFGAIDSMGTPSTLGAGGTGDSKGRCIVISPEQARSMAAAEVAAGARRDLDLRASEWTYRSERESGARILVEMRWLLPYQARDCGDAWNR